MLYRRRWSIGGIGIVLEGVGDLATTSSWDSTFPNFQVNSKGSNAEVVIGTPSSTRRKSVPGFRRGPGDEGEARRGRVPGVLNRGGTKPSAFGAVETRNRLPARGTSVPISANSLQRSQPPGSSLVEVDARWWSRVSGVGMDDGGQPEEHHKDIELKDVLRCAVAQVMPATGALMLHASAVCRDGRVWVFSGRGGVGKTTIATELAGGGECYAVDRVVIRQGSDGICRVYPTPFSDHSNLVSRREATRAAGLVFIRQSARDHLERLDSVAALRMLLGHVTVMRRYAWLDRRILDLAVEIVSTLPCYELDFRRDEAFWGLINETEYSPAK